MSGVGRRNFVFFIHTAMLRERLLSTCGSGTRAPTWRSNLHYVEANVDREPLGWGHLPAKRAVWRLGRLSCKAFLRSLHTGTLHLKFKAGSLKSRSMNRSESSIGEDEC